MAQINSEYTVRLIIDKDSWFFDKPTKYFVRIALFRHPHVCGCMLPTHTVYLVASDGILLSSDGQWIFISNAELDLFVLLMTFVATLLLGIEVVTAINNLTKHLL